MRIKPQIAPVVGETSSSHWAQTLTLPGAYAVLEVRDEDEIARSHGLRILSELTRLLTDPPVSLQELGALADRVIDDGVESLIIIVPVGQVVYIVSRRSGAVFLKRGNMLSRLVTGDGSVSGELALKDTLLLASGAFLAAVPDEELAESFDHLPAKEAAEKLTLMLHQKGPDTPGAALVYQVERMVSEEELLAESGGDEDAVRPVFMSRRRVSRGVRRLLKGDTGPVRTVVKGALRRLRSRKSIKILLVALAVVAFGVSVYIGVRRDASSKGVEGLGEAMVQAQALYDEGMGLSELNPIKSRETLRTARSLIAPFLETTRESSKEGREVRELGGKIDSAIGLLLQEQTVTPEPYYDVTLITSEAKAISAFSRAGDTLSLLDSSGAGVYSITASSKSAVKVVTGSALALSLAVATDGERHYVLTPSGVFVAEKGETLASKPVIDAEGWDRPAAIATFGGNVYVLDTGKSAIWKYTGTESGFGSAVSYLPPDALVDLSQATSMAIDGSVWVAIADGRILRFSAGKEVSFVTQGIEPALGNRLLLSTDEDSERLYVLDQSAGRIVVLDKEGMYVAQYSYGTEIIPTAFTVSEPLKKVILLSSGILYAFDIK